MFRAGSFVSVLKKEELAALDENHFLEPIIVKENLGITGSEPELCLGEILKVFGEQNFRLKTHWLKAHCGLFNDDMLLIIIIIIINNNNN